MKNFKHFLIHFSSYNSNFHFHKFRVIKLVHIEKQILERDLYHRTITSHFKRHKICGYRRTGLHAGI